MSEFEPMDKDELADNRATAEWRLDKREALLHAPDEAIEVLRLHATIDALTARAEQAERELEDTNATFDLRHTADMRAIKRWQQAHPEKDLIFPDHADLVIWLMEQIQMIERERDTAVLALQLSEKTDLNLQVANEYKQRAEQAERERDELSQKMRRDALSTIPFVTELLESNAQLTRHRAVVEAAKEYRRDWKFVGSLSPEDERYTEARAAVVASREQFFDTVAALEDHGE